MVGVANDMDQELLLRKPRISEGTRKNLHIVRCQILSPLQAIIDGINHSGFERGSFTRKWGH